MTLPFQITIKCFSDFNNLILHIYSLFSFDVRPQGIPFQIPTHPDPSEFDQFLISRVKRDQILLTEDAIRHMLKAFPHLMVVLYDVVEERSESFVGVFAACEYSNECLRILAARVDSLLEGVAQVIILIF